MNHRRKDFQAIGMARRSVATLVAMIGTVVWAHALAGLFRAIAGQTGESIAAASPALTLAALGVALAGAMKFPDVKRAATLAAASGAGGTALIAWSHPEATIAATALIPVGAGVAALGAWLAGRLPARLDAQPVARPGLTVAWILLALLAVVQVGRLATYMTDTTSDWFLTTREPFYAKHECLNAYVYGAELNRRGEADIYDPVHYPGLNRNAEPRTEMRGMTPEDPFQYAPQFLLWPHLAISLTDDFTAIRPLWFGINVTLCMGAVLLLALWVGGRVGQASALLAPLVLVAFPTLHNFQYGQFHFATIALAVLAMIAFARNRSALGGALLAVSILSKLFPALLLVPLAVQRRWRDLGWTAAAGAVLTLITFALFGATPFEAFLGHLPRLADGSAFAFGEAWPEVADLVVAGNQGVQGMVTKLGFMGMAGTGWIAKVVGPAYALLLLIAGIAIGRRGQADRAQQAIAWVGLLGLGSLASTGAWADYVPLTCVWLAAILLPYMAGRPVVQQMLAVVAALQMSLIGTMPIGETFHAGWMVPLSLFTALAMLATFAAAIVMPAPSAFREENVSRTGPPMRGVGEPVTQAAGAGSSFRQNYR